MRVIEFTGGSTGSSLGMVCAAKGYRFVVLSSDAFSREKLLTMKAFGADLRIVPSDGGKVTPALFDRFRKEIAVLAAEPDTFWTDQFHNEDAIRGYMDIGHELLEQTGGQVDAFCGAVGTGGMVGSSPVSPSAGLSGSSCATSERPRPLDGSRNQIRSCSTASGVPVDSARSRRSDQRPWYG